MDKISAAKAGTLDQARRTIRIGLALWSAAAAILVAGIVWLGIPGVFEFNAPDFMPVPGFLALALAVFGTIHLAQGFVQSARFGKYGASTLEAGPAVLGQVYRGRIRTDRAIEASGPYTVRLQCESRSAGDSDGEARNRQKTLLWEQIVTVPATTRSSIGIPFAFHIPADGIPNRAGSAVTGHEIYWTLSASAPIAGLHYRAEFPVDVGATDAEAEEEEEAAARLTPASLEKAFVGQARPVLPEHPGLRVARFAAPVIGILLFAAGAYSTFLQWSHGRDGVALGGKITSVERPAVDVALDGGGTVRVARVTKNNIWQVGQPVQITCLREGPEFRSCRMDTGVDRWIDALGTLGVGTMLLLLGGWLWSRRRGRVAGR